MSGATLGDEFEPETADRVLSALSDECHRLVLAYFRESPDDVASLEELAGYVATRDAGDDGDAQKRAAIRLHHVGLPKLEAAGIVEYDSQSKTVRCRDPFVLRVDADGELV